MIEDYIKYISLKRKELGGHAICPFAKRFLDKTVIIESKDLEADAVRCIESKERPMLWMVYGCPNKFNKEWLESFCEKHKEKCKSEKFSYIFNPPYNKLTVKNPSKDFDNNECTITLKSIMYGTDKFYWNPKTNYIYDYSTKQKIGKKINNEEIVFDDGEDY